MGTPLSEKKADGTPYLSGTEWEFENALAANKPVLVYRGSEKVLFDSDDPDFDERITHKRRVDTFFKRLVEDGCSHTMYSSPAELLPRVRLDVEKYLSTVLQFGRAEPGRETGEQAGTRRRRKGAAGGRVPDVPVAYREWVKKQYGGVDLLGLQLKKGRPPSLSAIYVPQTTTAPAEPERPSGDENAAGPKDAIEAERDRHALVLSRLAHESLYVSGANQRRSVGQEAISASCVTS